MTSKEPITVAEAGHRGGITTRDRYAGTGFYQRIGAKGGNRQKELYAALLAEFGKLGGRPRRPNLDDTVGEGSLQKKEGAISSGNPPPA